MADRGGASHPLVELTRSRFREFLREPEAVFWVFAFPVIMTCALGVAFRARGTEAVIVGIASGEGEAAIRQALEAQGGFTIRPLAPGDVDRLPLSAFRFLGLLLRGRSQRGQKAFLDQGALA